MEDQDRSRLQESCFQRDVYVVSDSFGVLLFTTDRALIILCLKRGSERVLFYIIIEKCILECSLTPCLTLLSQSVFSTETLGLGLLALFC